jgi:outer membrane scaffolding protein for murein synthesis (MipA/OmpV family)
MGFQGSQMAMGDLGTNWREAWVNHAFTPRGALGLGALYMRSDDKTRSRTAVEINATRLLARWNLPHAQANAWLVLGVGGITGNDFDGTRALFAPGVQLDYETTRVYLAAFARLYRASGLKHDYGALRAGFSFYEAEYEQTQPWLIVEARRMRELSDEIEITPMLRLINKGYFVEAGVNQHKQARLNLMIIF